MRTVEEASKLIRDFVTAFRCNGVTGQVTLGTANPFASSFYFSTYLTRKGTNGNFQTIFAKRDSYAANGMMFSMAMDATTGAINLDTVTSFVPWGYVPTVDRKTHLAWVHDKVLNRDKLYVDGELYSNQSVSILGTKTNALISLGACQNPGTDILNGDLDDSVIGIGTPPTDKEIYQLFSKGIKPGELWAYLKYDVQNGSIVKDSSGKGNNGVKIGGSYI